MCPLVKVFCGRVKWDFSLFLGWNHLSDSFWANEMLVLCDCSFPPTGRKYSLGTWHLMSNEVFMLPQSFSWAIAYTIILVTWCETWIISKEAVGFSAYSIWAHLNRKLIVVEEKWLAERRCLGCDGVLKSWCRTLKWECSEMSRHGWDAGGQAAPAALVL